MIKIGRPCAPAILDATSVQYIDELNRATIHFNTSPLPKQSFKFSLYSHVDVVAELRRMFGRHCAYCESEYAAVTPMDVEHFRPKGGYAVHISGKLTLQRPGYWWLAATWDNLLACCPDCNRKRTKEVETEEDCIELVAVGKANSFPLEDETKRAKAPGQEAEEHPLLLNPCVDSPAEHLEFDRDGMVLPITVRGSESIKVYGLRRKDLIDARAEHAIAVEALIDMLKREIEDFNHDPTSQAKSKAIVKRIDNIIRFAKRGRYKALTRKLVVDALEPILPELSKKHAAFSALHSAIKVA